jgi:hypothetical protein
MRAGIQPTKTGIQPTKTDFTGKMTIYSLGTVVPDHDNMFSAEFRVLPKSDAVEIHV